MKVDGIEIKDSERTRCEVWTRVMGYHRPISSFNVGKKGEVAKENISLRKLREKNVVEIRSDLRNW